jgi:hypothetical protein
MIYVDRNQSQVIESWNFCYDDRVLELNPHVVTNTGRLCVKTRLLITLIFLDHYSSPENRGGISLSRSDRYSDTSPDNRTNVNPPHNRHRWLSVCSCQPSFRDRCQVVHTGTVLSKRYTGTVLIVFRWISIPTYWSSGRRSVRAIQFLPLFFQEKKKNQFKFCKNGSFRKGSWKACSTCMSCYIVVIVWYLVAYVI